MSTYNAKVIDLYLSRIDGSVNDKAAIKAGGEIVISLKNSIQPKVSDSRQLLELTQTANIKGVAEHQEHATFELNLSLVGLLELVGAPTDILADQTTPEEKRQEIMIDLSNILHPHLKTLAEQTLLQMGVRNVELPLQIDPLLNSPEANQ